MGSVVMIVCFLKNLHFSIILTNYGNTTRDCFAPELQPLGQNQSLVNDEAMGQ